MTDAELVVELLERVTRLETKQEQAESQRVEMLTDVKQIKTEVTAMAHAQKVRDTKFGTVVWVVSAMATAIASIFSLVIQWFKHVGTGGP